MIPRRRARTYPGQVRALLSGLLFGSGDGVEGFQEALARYLGVRFVLLTASGRQALDLLLAESGLAAGARIVFPALSLRDLLVRVQSAGYRPVVVDVEERSLNIAPQALDAVEHWDAVVATHLFGNPCRLPGVQAAAKKRGAVLFEDCAHALGARYDGAPVGTFGLGSIFSFEAIKSVNTFGGGCVATNDAALAARIEHRLASLPLDRAAVAKKCAVSLAMDLLLRSPLYRPLTILMGSELAKQALTRVYLSMRDATVPRPTAYHPAQATVGVQLLKSLDAMNQRCRQLAEAYRTQLGGRLAVQQEEDLGQSNRYIISALCDGDARDLQRELARRGIDVGIGEELVDDCSGFAGGPPCPVAQAAVSRLVQLPGYHQMTDRDLHRVVRAVAGALA
ncbi:MAG: DegT/DnrJ/EryC1/StrS aminotransferase family protein [Pseudomonadota bacterium]